MKIYRQTTLGGPAIETWKQVAPSCWSKEVSECVRQVNYVNEPWCQSLYKASDAALKESEEEYDAVNDTIKPCNDWPTPIQAALFGAFGLLGGVIIGKLLKMAAE